MTISCELTLYKIPSIHYVCAGIVGNLEEVGCWSLNRVLRSHTSSDGLHHVRVNLPEETKLEYKWVLFDGASTWMWEPGPNKVVDLPRYGSCFIMNQWDGPAVVDTHVPETSSSSRRSNRAEAEWKLSTQGTIYKNPEPIAAVTPSDNVPMFMGSKIPIGENHITKNPQSSQVIESSRVEQIVEKYDKGISGPNIGAPCIILTPKDDIAAGSCCCAGTNGKDASSASRVECECNSVDRTILQPSVALPNYVRTFATSCYNRLANLLTDFSSDPYAARIAVITGLTCLVAYGAYKATKH